jgi:Bacteriocin-protection, YdeI or OmpD-Associated/Domain of unknown function (DUF1905)
MPQLEFECELEADQEAVFFRVPAEVLAAIGRGKRAPVMVTINGYRHRTRIAVYGGRYYVGLRREVREAAGVKVGDQLRVGLEYDAELRLVDLPEDLKAALANDPKAAAAFERLSYTSKKELVDWLAGAKHDDTRQRRLAQAMRMLRAPRSGRW